MPRATMLTEGVRHELKTCPEGYILIKQMSYSEMLARRDIVTRLSMQQGKGNDKINVELANLEANKFSFKHCIVDHNLEDEYGTRLDFTNSMTLQILDPRVGAEIERLIDEMNQEGDDEDQEVFTPAATSSSTNSLTEPYDNSGTS